MKKVKVKIISTTMTHLEKSLLDLAIAEIGKGQDILILDLRLQLELETWKRERIRYRNAPTTIRRDNKVISMHHHGALLFQLESLI